VFVTIDVQITTSFQLIEPLLSWQLAIGGVSLQLPRILWNPMKFHEVPWNSNPRKFHSTPWNPINPRNKHTLHRKPSLQVVHAHCPKGLAGIPRDGWQSRYKKLLKIAIDSWFMLIYPIKMMIFHNYVSLPEGKYIQISPIITMRSSTAKSWWLWIV